MDVPPSGVQRTKERRKEPRLYCHWPVWFTEGLGKTLYRGRMLDISSEGVAFTCQAEKKFPRLGQKVTTHFDVPRTGSNDASDMTTFTRVSHVYRIDALDKETSRVAVHFDEPLNFTPGKLKAVNLMLSPESPATGGDSQPQ